MRKNVPFSVKLGFMEFIVQGVYGYPKRKNVLF